MGRRRRRQQQDEPLWGLLLRFVVVGLILLAAVSALLQIMNAQIARLGQPTTRPATGAVR